jgi:phosphoglycolate phosphatase
VSRKSRPFPGVVEGLQAMYAAGYRLACITNKAEPVSPVPLLKDTGLFDFLRIDPVRRHPAGRRSRTPLPLLHACQVFGVEPDELLLIGDSLNDTQAARAAGCSVFCVPYGYNRGRPVAELDLDAVVVSPGRSGQTDRQEMKRVEFLDRRWR